jgi:hypothetical protein
MLYFKLEELVDKSTFENLGAEAWLKFSSNALIGLEKMREFFGVPFTINNWHIGGQFQYRGYRPPECKIGARLSQHRLGNAFDIDIKGWTAEIARKHIINNQDDPLLQNIMRLEDGVSWVHVDFLPVKNRIHLFNP